jgi:hypothetical protein
MKNDKMVNIKLSTLKKLIKGYIKNSENFNDLEFAMILMDKIEEQLTSK